MSSTPRTDALDAKHTAQLDALVKAVEAGQGSVLAIFEQAKEMLIAYGLLCAELEKALAAGNELDRPALVGNTRFGIGIKWETVIERAQRQHEYEVTPEKEAARLERVRAFVHEVEPMRAALVKIARHVPTPEDSVHGPRMRCQHCGHAWVIGKAVEHHGDNCAYVLAAAAIRDVDGGENPILTDFMKGTTDR